MNRSELIKKVAERVGSEEAAARRHVDAVFEAVMESVSAGERVVVTGFGTFDRFSRPARSARNPRTGTVVDVPATEVPRFRVGQTFKSRVAQNSTAEPAAETVTLTAEEAPVAAVKAASPKKSKKSKDSKEPKDRKGPDAKADAKKTSKKAPKKAAAGKAAASPPSGKKSGKAKAAKAGAKGGGKSR